MKRFTLLFSALTLISAVALAACQPTTTQEAAPPADTTATPEAAPPAPEASPAATPTTPATP
ncbi:MAG: hypothetical protein ACRC8A_06125 [Microcoleaceae cyanobacterium]